MQPSYPSISIIIPLYKVEDYIEDCLHSIMMQDYEGKIECILIDDCSPDKSLTVAQQFSEKHKNDRVDFRFYRQDRNRKQSAARNKGLELARNELILYIDADDWILPSTLSKMTSLLDKYPQSQMVQAGITTEKPEEAPWFAWLESKTWNKDIEYTEDRQWIIDTCAARRKMIPMSPVNKLFRRSFLIDNKITFAEGFYHEDEVWLTLLSKYLTNVAFLHEDTYLYRINVNSTTNGGKLCHFEDIKTAWIEILKLLDKDFCPWSVLKQIDFDTSRMYKENKEWKVKWIMIETKFRLFPYCSIRTRLRLTRWIIQHIWKDLIHQPYNDK